MKTRILLIIFIVATLLLFTGCLQGDNVSQMTIEPDGSGTKTLTFTFPRDHMSTQEKIDAGDYNSKLFPQGQSVVLDWIRDEVPEGFTVDWNEYDDYWEYIITYSFSDIDDYNAKTRAMIPDDVWNDNFLEEATMVIEEVDGGFNITFRESLAILKYSTLGYFQQLHTKPDIFDATRGGIDTNVDPDTHFRYGEVEVEIGDEVETVATPLDENDHYTVDLDPNGFIEITAFVAADSGETPTVTQTPDGTEPGDSNNVLFILFAFSLGIILITKRNRAKA